MVETRGPKPSKNTSTLYSNGNPKQLKMVDGLLNKHNKKSDYIF